MIVLLGFMGAGKSTVGGLLAARLGLPFADADAVIEERLGRPIADVFATEGEAVFREVEQATVADLVAGPERVVALGGGAAQDPRTRRALAGCRVVHLRVGFEQAMARVGDDPGRPVLSDPRLTQRYSERLPVYTDLAALEVDTDGRDPQEIVHDIVTWLGAGARTGPPAE